METLAHRAPPAGEALAAALARPEAYGAAGPVERRETHISVLVGGVAGRVVREAACPVIVLPRHARHLDEDSLFAEAASGAAAV